MASYVQVHPNPWLDHSFNVRPTRAIWFGVDLLRIIYSIVSIIQSGPIPAYSSRGRCSALEIQEACHVKRPYPELVREAVFPISRRNTLTDARLFSPSNPWILENSSGQRNGQVNTDTRQQELIPHSPPVLVQICSTA